MDAERAVISVDLMGGDRGPQPLVASIERFAKSDDNLRFLLFGPEERLAPLLKRYKTLAEIAEIRHAPDEVRMDDKPARTLRDRRESSMWHAVGAVSSGEAGVVVSAGNTGALLAMSVLRLGKADGVQRPAIAVHWPAEHPLGFTTVLDVGADYHADPANLVQYAVLGAEYAHLSLRIERPRVGLLNLGSERTKGPTHLGAAHDLLEAAAKSGARFDFHGFVEGSDISGDAVDVIVTDGFTGNVALKTAEGTAAFLRNTLRDAFKHSWASRFASLMAYGSLQRLRRRIDPRRVNGGVFLGLDGAVVKSHGSADAVGFSSALGLAARMARADFTGQVASQLAKLDIGPKADADSRGA